MRALAAFAALIVAAAGSSAGDPERAAGLVPLLGHADFAEREAATRALDAIGDPALPALRLAAAAPDAEVARRAADLVEQLTRRAAARKLLTPTRVTVTPAKLGRLTDAWRKLTGVEFLLEPASLGDVPVPTRLPKAVPLWAAVAAVAADLKLSVTCRPSASGPEVVVLSPRADGDAAWAAFTGHAVGVAALPPPAGVVLPADSHSLILQALPEPGLQFQRLRAVVIFKAIDERGRDLATLPGLVKPPPPPPVFRGRGLRGGGRIVLDADGVALIPEAARTTFTPTATQALVRFARPPGDPPPTRLTLVEGVLRATVAGPAEDLARVTGLDLKPLAATTDRGVSLNVMANAQAGDGTATVVVTVVTPANEVVFGDEGGGRRSTPSAAAALTVTDASGEPFEASVNTATIRPQADGRVAEQLFVRLQPTGTTRGGPVAVTLRGSRNRGLDIPFTLAGVPLHAGPPAPPATPTRPVLP
jgi:hypothetical protein